MKNFTFILSLIAAIGSGVSLASNSTFQSFGFTAPVVSGHTTNIPYPSRGDIIFDDADDTFYGNSDATTSGWTALGGGSGAALPPGVFLPFGGSSAPSGYLLADGSAVSRTTYANLFAVIGTTFGAGDGSTTFNLPDTRNVFLRGANGSTRSINSVTYPAVTLGATENDKMQGHRHTSNDAVFKTGSSGGTPSSIWFGGTTASNTSSPVSDGANGTPRTGSETSPVNLGVNYIIKY